MAVESSSGYNSPTSSGGRKKNPLALTGLYMKFRLFRIIVRIFGVIIGVSIILFFLFGLGNQRAAFEGIMNFGIDTGTDVGQAMDASLEGKDDAPFSIGTQGIYIKGYEPDSQVELADLEGSQDSGSEDSEQEQEENGEQPE